MRIADLISKRLAVALACLPIVLAVAVRAADAPPAPSKPPDAKKAAPAPVPKAAKPADEAKSEAATPAKPAPKPAAKAADKAEIRFQFDGIPYDDVIRRFAQMAGKPILGEYHVEGTLTFFDPQPYTFDEAFDTLNLLLAMRGYTAVDTPRFLRVVPIKEAMKAPLRIVKGWDEADKLRPGQLMTMMLPLKFISAEDAVRVLMPVVSTYGTVAPLGRGRGIIITDRLENMKRIRVILDELDTGTLSSESVLKTYRLKHASAQSIVGIINTLFPVARTAAQPKYIRDKAGKWVRNPNYGQKPDPSELGVKAIPDQRTNTLFLSGSGEKIALAEQIIEQLDAIEPGATGDMRIFDLKNARAEDLANTIKQLLPQRYVSSSSSSSRYSSSRSQTMQARVVADVNTNRLIVTAPLDQMVRIEELIRTLDQASQEVGGMRVFKLKVADAKQLERVIEGAISRSSGDPRSRYSSSRYGSSRSAMSTRVSSDTRTNSLIVSGSAGDIRIAEQLITELDKPIEEGEQTREIHVVQLQVGDARELASSLTRMLGQGDPSSGSSQSATNVRIVADGGTNSLLISAAPGDWPTIEKLLKQLKATPVPRATGSTRIIPLQHAKARELADSLNRIYEARRRSYAYSRSRSSRPFVPVTISASDRSNCLLVSAAADDQKAIAELVATMDTPSAEKVDPVHIIQVAFGDAAKIAETLRGLLPSPEPGRPQTVFIRGDAASNSIVIRAPEAEFKALEQMVQQLDKAITTSGGIRTFRLKVADAQQLAGVLQNALARREPGRHGTPAYQTVVGADVRTNSLIVAGPAGDIQTAEKLIAELDKPLAEQAREIHVVPLKVGDARELAQALTRMLAQQSGTGRRGEVSANDVRVEAESVTNSLLISAAPGDWPTIEKLLSELKTSAIPLATATTRIVPLKHANARELAETLRQVYASRGPGSSRPWYSSRGYQSSAGPGTGAGGPLVQGPDHLDDGGDRGRWPARWDAVGVQRRRDRNAAFLLRTQRYATGTGPQPEERRHTTVPVVIVASEQTNSLLVSAADDDQKTIAELIKVLDVPSAEGAEPMRMIRLQSADAVQLAGTLKAMVPRPKPGETESVVIEAEPLSNSVLIRGPEADRKMFEEMIATLDQATQQQAREIRRIQLKHVSASQLAQMLGQLYRPGPVPAADRGERVVIAAAPGDRTLVVDAPRDKIEEIATLVASLDVADAPAQVADAPAPVEVRTYRLTSANAAELAVSLSRLFAQQRSRRGAPAEDEPEPRFEADGATNQVIVAATPTQFEVIDELIKKLEVATSLARETKMFRLKAAKAADIVGVLQTMLVDTPAGATGRGRGGKTADVRVAAMPDTNDVVVQGPPEKLALAEELIKTFDAEGAAGQTGIVIVKLKNAQAESLAEAVNSALASKATPVGSRFRRGPVPAQQDRVMVTPELNSNCVLVRGPLVEIPAVVEMIKALDDGSTGTGAEVRVYPLENGEASALAASLGRLFQDMLRQQAGRSRNAPAVPFSIAADDRTQSLVISTTPSHFALIEQILHSLDQAPAAPEADVQYIWLANADAVEVAAQLEDMYKTRKGNKPVISADEFSNAITIIAKEADLKVIEPIITKLDKAAKDNSYRVRVIPLTSVKAEKMAQILRSVYQQMTGNKVTLTTETPEATKGPEGESGPVGVEGPGRAPAPDADTQEPGDADTGAAPPGVTIAVDKNSNSLIVSGSRQELDYIQDLVDELMWTSMDVDAEFRVFKIEKADPQTVARTLDELFNPKPKPQPKGQKGPPAPAPPPVISVVADLRTRSVIVRAKPLDFEDVEMLIKQLDQVPTVVSEVRIFPLKNTDATEVARNLKDLFQRAVQRPAAPKPQPKKGGQPKGQQPQQQRVEMIRQVLELRTKQGITQVDIASMVNVSANRQTNSVIVTAPVDAMEIVAGIIEELDQSGMAAVTSIRMYPVKNAEIAPTVTALREVFGATTKTTTAGKRSAKTVLDAEIIITGDEAGRMIIVSAPAEEHKLIESVIMQMDEAQGLGDITIKVYRLQNAEASAVATALSATVDRSASGGTRRSATGSATRGSSTGQVQISADRSSNSLVVRAGAEDHDQIVKLIEQLDSGAAAGLRSEMLILENAKAEDLAPVLEKMAKSSTAVTTGASRYGTRAATAGQQAVTVSAEKGSNALVISGPSSGVDKIVQMAKDLDKATTSSAAMVRVIPLTNGDAPNVAAMVQDLYRQQYMIAAREKRSIDPLAVSSDARANAIVLATSDEMYKQVSEWVAQIEKMQPQRGALKIITLKHADPTEVERAIQQIFGEAVSRSVTPVRRRRSPSSRSRGSRGAPGATGRQGPTGGKVETTVLPQQRSILINASDADYEIIKKLVEALDAAAADAKRQYKVFALKNASNARVATALTALYRAVPGIAARPEDQVTVTALANTDAVVVSATAEKMEEVDHLIQQLDKEEVAPQLEFRIYPLENAQPAKLMPVLQQMLNQVRQMRPGEPLNVQADERTRSIIVTARGPMFDQVETIIKTLDKKPAFAETEVLIIPLKHADATRLATVLTDMLRPSATAQVTPEARALQEQVRLLKVRSADGRVIPQLDLTKPIKITADPTLANAQGSNALLISSTPDNLKAMAAIVGVLDRVPLAEGTKVRVVHLKNADAESVADVLKDIFTQGQRLGGKEQTSVEGKAEPDSVTGKALTNPLNVSADLRTNSLVLSGIEESLALADLVIQDLDRDAGKIVTEVRVFHLKYADVARLVPVLQAVFGESPPTAGTEGLKTQVTRLRTVLEKGKGVNVTDVPKARPALTIQADPTTSAIVVAARSDVMPLIADVIKTMDIPGAGSLNVVQIIPLVNADATRLKGVIDGLYTGPNAQFARPEDVPTVQVDTRTNALVVSASEKTFAMVGTLLKGLDAKQPIAMRDIRIVPLKNAEATTIGPVLQQLMDARVQRFATLGAADAEALRVIIMADARSNSLLIGGSAEGFQLAKSLAEQLDGASPAISGQIQLFPLEHANAGTISTTLQNLFTQRYQAARTVDIQRQRPIILPDVRVNALLVAANADDTKVIQGLLKKLDVELKDPSVRLVVIPLEHNDCGLVGPMLQRLFAARLQSMTLPGQTPVPQDRVDIETDPLSNALIVSASKENLALITGLLGKVDVAPPDETGIVRMYTLQNSDAQRIATMLQALITQGLYKPGMIAAGPNQVLADREKVSITVDVRTNTLIVSASRENFAVLEEIIRKIDSSEDFSVLGDLRMFTLKNANATRLAPTLQQLFDAKRAAEVAAGGTGRMLPVSVIADARTNTLLVAGSRESFNAIEAMIRELDTDQVLAANEFRIFYLKQATATVLQPTLEQLFAQRATRGEPIEPVTIVTEPRTNSLIVSASPEDMKLAESLIARLDAEPDRPGTTVQVFPLAKADATQVAGTLTSLYQMPGAAAGPTVGISVDERINAIVIQAGPADQKRIGELVKELDSDTVPRVTEIRVFTLENADATEMATILNDALNQKPTPLTATSPNRQALLQFVTHSQDGGKLVTSALQEGVLITPDRRSNSLVISAPLENMPLLESLIKAMDSTSPRTAEIRVFTLINSDARAMAQVLNELFRMQQTAGAAGGKQAIEYTLTPAEGDAKGPAAVIGSAEDVALTVTVDIRTNSLLVGGTKHYVELASKVVQELDESTAAERLTEVYRLRNAQAEDIEAALTNFLDQERALLEEQLGADGAGTSQYILEREVAIVAEPTSNTLLLSASPRYYDVVAQMIQELDQPPPQVLIQVLLAEVTIDETNEFGIEWQAMETWRGHDLTGGTAPAFAASAGLTLNPGFQVSVTGGDVNFMLRALQSQGRLEVLSRPQILASDNQQATINIGQRVPFITNSRITEEGTTINTIEYQDVGIILDVTPRINPDGFVKLEVHPEISALDDSTVPISEGVNAIIVNNRSAETTVTVQDGHTIIIGGLITTTDRDRLNKVPFLGDIPGLGWLFRSTRKVKERTELLIILTPTVLRNIEEADIETASQVKRLNLLRGTRAKQLKDQTFEEFSDKLWDELKVTPNGEKADKPAPRPSTRIHVPAQIEKGQRTP